MMIPTGEYEGLFEEPERRELHLGDKVMVRTMWGEESCRVHAMGTIDGFPMVTVKTASGDTVTVNRAAIRE